MQLRNKEKLAYYSALTLLFSYAEFLLPHLPFLKLGLGNIVILLALDFAPLDFISLLVLKSVTSSFISGTLFSPFFLISFCQSLGAGSLMYLISIANRRLFKEMLFSVYGISLCGAAASSYIQIVCAALYLGKEVYNILGFMLLFSLFSGLLTAFISTKFGIYKVPVIKGYENKTKEKKKLDFLSIILVILLIIVPFVIKSLWILTVLFAILLIFQLLNKRKLRLLPHISLWIFIIFLSFFSGGGKVLLRLGEFTIYEAAFFDAVRKCLVLSSVICISQSASKIRTRGTSVLGLTAAYFYSLMNLFYNTSGNVFYRIKRVLQQGELEYSEKEVTSSNVFILLIIQLALFILLLLADFNFPKISQLCARLFNSF
ncbi:Gx transporter family protein [Treponema sp. C6A8]|uniref:Gx transporter family protein n=1 Tax=Treponema sp. C6A8 TaxID=1410609 RepID=UPI000688095B|nr:Gx transporter family protein [Treponema sp. C6A8]